MTFMFRFNVGNIVSTRTTVMAIVFITCCHTTMTIPIFENVFCLRGKKIIRCVFFFVSNIFICMTFRLANNIQSLWSYYSFFMPYVVYDGLWDAQVVRCLRCGMWDVRDMGCLEYGMFRMWNVWDVRC